MLPRLFGRSKPFGHGLISRAARREGLEVVKGSNSRQWTCQSCRHQSSGQSPTRLGDNSKQTTWTRRRKLEYYTPLQPPALRRSFASSIVASGQQKPETDQLPSQSEGQRSHLAKSFSHLMDHMQSNIFIAGQRLNDLTGYSGIEALKKSIEVQGEHCTILLNHKPNRQ